MKTASDVQRSIQQSRQRIALEYVALSEELNVASRLRHSVQRKPWAWISGAALTGVALSFFRPSHRVKISTPKKPKAAQLSSSTIMEEEKSVSTLSKVIVVTTAILENQTLRAGLFSAARFLYPLLQQAVTNYAARKRAATAVIARD